MTVYREKGRRTYRYDFWFRGRRYQGSTHQITRQDAKDVEEKKKLRLRHAAGGILRPDETPRVQEWAGVHYTYMAERVTRPERIDDLLRVLLRFWGARPSGTDPKNPPVKGEPYHDLHLADPIEDSDWLLAFEQWMARRVDEKTKRPISNQTKNHYRSAMSAMYRTALLPQFRKQTGITVNPFIGLPRDATVGRQISVTVDELTRWLDAASYHVRLAMAIAALAPKLRLAGILALRWDDNLDAGLTRISVTRHKTAHRTGMPQVVEVSAQLRAILADAKKRARGPYVVNYRGEPVESIRGGVHAAATRAEIPYGMRQGGVTFHAIRHAMATLLAELGVPESQRMIAMGHRHIATTQRYTHLRPVHERETLEQLSAAVPIVDVVTKPGRRAVTGTVGENARSRPRRAAKS